jgi:hypothetical protein
LREVKGYIAKIGENEVKGAKGVEMSGVNFPENCKYGQQVAEGFM